MGDGPTNRPTDGRTQSLIEVLFAPKNPWFITKLEAFLSVPTLLFRCEEHLYKRLRPSVGRLVGPSPTMRLRGKLVTSRLLREEEEEEETDYVAIPLRRDSFAPRD